MVLAYVAPPRGEKWRKYLQTVWQQPQPNVLVQLLSNRWFCRQKKRENETSTSLSSRISTIYNIFVYTLMGEFSVWMLDVIEPNASTLHTCGVCYVSLTAFLIQFIVLTYYIYL